MKPILINILKFAISAGLIYYLFRQATNNDEFATFFDSPKNWMWLSGAFLSCVLAYLAGFVRWHLFVRVLDIPFSLVDAIRIGFIGLFFCVFTIGVVGGDTLRAFYVCRHAPDRKPEAIASVVFDRLVGLLTMVGVAAVAFSMLDLSGLDASPASLAALRYAGSAVVVLTMVGFVGFVTLFLIPHVERFAWFKKLVTMPKVGPLLLRMIQVVTVYRRRPLAVFVGFLLSLLVNVFFATTIYGVAVGLGSGHPTMAEHFLIEPISMVSNALPLPGGLGGMEVMLDFLYRTLASNGGIMVAFVFRFMMLIASAVGGIVWLLNRESISKLQHEAEADSPE